MTSSVVTLTDLFCGAGGSSQGARHANAEVRMAANHWAMAIKTHQANFPKTDHDCADISQAQPRRYPTTTMLWASPECPHHAGAAGRKRDSAQLTFLENGELDPSAVRSRATMWDVVRFAEYHGYKAVIVENVVEARKWRLFDSWLQTMQNLGYKHHICYLNSMFFGAPQSRDRMYVVFWKKEMPAPDLDFRPKAMCPRCDKDINAVQAWKNPEQRWGRYGGRRQYLYVCPSCQEIVNPYYVPALVAIDWSDPGTRIGDRKRPLAEKTMKRIEYGLEKYGHQYLVVDLAYAKPEGHIKPMTEPLPTQTARQTLAMTMPFFFSYVNSEGHPHSVEDPLLTICTSNGQGLAFPPSAVMSMRHLFPLRGVDDPLPTVVAGGSTAALIRMPFLAVNYTPGHCRAVTDELSCITSVDHHSLVTPEPFLVNYYGNSMATGVGEPMACIPTVEHHGLVRPGELRVEDCFFRMLQPLELGRGMTFESDYIVFGNKREQTRQYGNAVTPITAKWLCGQVTPIFN